MPTIKFITDLKLSPPKTGKLWDVLESFEVVIDEVMIKVSAGTKTDGASIPRFLWRVVDHPFQRLMIYAAVVHDAGYHGTAKAIDATTRQPIETDKDFFDKAFLDIMLHCGVSRVKAYIAYKGVSIFGGSSWEAGHQNG